MRVRFLEQLDRLNNEMIVMGAMCEDVITCAMEALLEGDDRKRKEVFEIDAKIDQQEKDIESLCMKLLLQQQPVAGDLRMISSALKMITDMERIGDQASDIAELVPYIKTGHEDGMVQVKKMAEAVIYMVTESINSYVKNDMKLAQDVIEYDDIVDDLFNEAKERITETIVTDRKSAERCLDLFMVAKYLERIGDHATNIAEWVAYSMTGTHEMMPEN